MDASNADLLSVVATVATVGFFANGLVVANRIIRNGTTGDVSLFPYLCQFVSCVLQLKYGVLIMDWSIIGTNALGALLGAYYILIFWLHASNKTATQWQIVRSFIATFIPLLYIQVLVDKPEDAVFQMGVIASGFAVVMFGSPLVQIGRIIQTRSSDGLTLSTTLLNILVPGLWVVYGYLIDDWFVIVPNVLGGLLGVIQLILLRTFANEKSSIQHV